MKRKSKIADNPSIKGMIGFIDAVEGLEAIYNSIPLSQKLFPKLNQTFSNFSSLKEQAKIVLLPDKFNEAFSSYGWVAYESINTEVMKRALELKSEEGLECAEIYLADSYDDKALEFGIKRFQGNPDFKKRTRLADLAREDYLSGRYHACVPLLLSLIDGLVNDVSKHVGFFAQNVELKAWDCIAAHESGLQTLASIFTQGRNKTNDDSISIPYRNGILHGRELAFDNKLVAAKCWAALFAARDWAAALDEGKKKSQPEEKLSWTQLAEQIHYTNRTKKAIEEWVPRASENISYLPFEGESSKLPKNSPERAVSEFLNHWCNKRFGPLADALLYYTDTPKGKKAGIARQDFGKHIPISFKIIGIEDRAAATSNISVALTFSVQGKEKIVDISVSANYQDADNNFLVRSMPGGYWKIAQNSFAKIIYSECLEHIVCASSKKITK